MMVQTSQIGGNASCPGTSASPSAAGSINAQQASLDQSVGTLVTQVNAITASLAQVNRQIQSISPNSDAGSLEDLRQADLTQLSQLIGINLSGAPKIVKDARGWVLTGELGGMNSVAEPMNVAPKAISISSAGAKFNHELPAHSVSVLRMKTK